MQAAARGRSMPRRDMEEAASCYVPGIIQRYCLTTPLDPSGEEVSRVSLRLHEACLTLAPPIWQCDPMD